MTADELDRLAVVAEVAFLGTRMGASTTKERFEAITDVCTQAPALVAEVRRLLGALHQIARRDDAEMAAAKTLHYDMRGWAQRALDGAA